jgi:hypothetical protein
MNVWSSTPWIRIRIHLKCWIRMPGFGFNESGSATLIVGKKTVQLIEIFLPCRRSKTFLFFANYSKEVLIQTSDRTRSIQRVFSNFLLSAIRASILLDENPDLFFLLLYIRLRILASVP